MTGDMSKVKPGTRLRYGIGRTALRPGPAGGELARRSPARTDVDTRIHRRGAEIPGNGECIADASEDLGDRCGREVACRVHGRALTGSSEVEREAGAAWCM